MCTMYVILLAEFEPHKIEREKITQYTPRNFVSNVPFEIP